MTTQVVAISGTVGKQVYPVTSTSAATSHIILRGLSTYNQTSACSVVIRDGNASGTVIVSHTSPAGNSNPFVFPGPGIRFDKGAHVKVLGTSGSLCYLLID